MLVVAIDTKSVPFRGQQSPWGVLLLLDRAYVAPVELIEAREATKDRKRGPYKMEFELSHSSVFL